MNRLACVVGVIVALLVGLALPPDATYSYDAPADVIASANAAPAVTSATTTPATNTRTAAPIGASGLRASTGVVRFVSGSFLATKAADHAIPIGPAPQNAAKVLERVTDKGAPFPGYKGGGTFENVGKGMRLPSSGSKGPIKYREWDVNPNIKNVDRGGERLVTGSDGSAYSTRDHYDTFVRIR